MPRVRPVGRGGLGKCVHHQSQTSQREVIQAPQRGYVQFAVSDLDIYLRENAEEILERF